MTASIWRLPNLTNVSCGRRTNGWLTRLGGNSPGSDGSATPGPHARARPAGSLARLRGPGVRGPYRLELLFLAHYDEAIPVLERRVRLRAYVQLAACGVEAEDNDGAAVVQDIVDGLARQARIRGDVDFGQDGSAGLARGQGIDELYDHRLKGREGHLATRDDVGREDAVGADSQHAPLALPISGAGDAQQ